MKDKTIALKNTSASYAKLAANNAREILHSINNSKRRAKENSLTSEYNEVLDAIHPSVIWGGIITAVVFLFFGLWAGFAPLDSAAIANGSVVLSASRKTVQHLEGGIIQEILVKEGDNVTKGQPLIHLNATSANSQQELLLGQFRLAKASEIRLLAERDEGKPFETRQAAVSGQINILQERIMQYNEQIKGLEDQTKEVRKQKQLIDNEVKSVSGLVEKGLEQKPRLLALQRRQSELDGETAKHASEIATIKGSISEAQLQIINVQNEYLKSVMTELKEVQQQISDLQEKIQASGDILKRTVITAPQAGKVTGLKYHTLGGVITPGAPIMDIVPQDDRLIIEAQVRPQDIDIVHEGLPAKVMLTAYKSRFVPRLEGKVTQVSADRFINDKTGEAYFLARIEINDGTIAKLTKNIVLYPGMPAEAFITTGESTLLQYMASPIIDSLRKSFKEE
ncbi:MAG: HlyD family secretion protein [Rickettsiaceae bacterium]|nr:HlyD family secretion protein [Rickettsiaceae bacterium]